jgi:uridine kinase
MCPSSSLAPLSDGGRRGAKVATPATSQPKLVGISGGSGSGKSWLATAIAQALTPHCALISLDNFYRDRSHLTLAQRKRINFDHPRAIDWELFREALTHLRCGERTQIPRYDFTVSNRLGESEEVEPKPLIIVEGLWTIAKKPVREIFNLSIFLTSTAQDRFDNRLKRDQAHRARSEESVRRQFWDQVEPMHLQHVEPQRRWADKVVSGPVGRAELRRLISFLSGLANLPPLP